MTHTTKHTPGPWEVNKSDVCIIGIAKPLGVGCVLPIADVQYNPSRENPGQHVANAALIAAAPAMYEALKFLTSEINLSTLNVRKDFSLLHAHACAVKAILQAEGKLL